MARKPPARPSLDIGRRQAAPAIVAGDNRRAGAREVSLDQVVPDPDQPRRDWSDAEAVEDLNELAASLKEFGVLQPLLVRVDGALDDGRTRYVIIAGGRRRAAAELAGVSTLPVVIRDEDGGRVRLMQLVENIQRRALSPLDEARAFQEIIDAEGITASDLSKRIHISPQTVRDRLLLLSDQTIADAVQRGQIGTAAARDVLRAADEPRNILRGLVDAGETVTQATVKDVCARAEAAGITNPRKTGGGRRKATPTSPDGEHNTYAPPVVVARQPTAPAPLTPLAQAAVRALLSAIEAQELRTYTDAKKAQDARYRIADDPYVAGFVAALAAVRRPFDRVGSAGLDEGPLPPGAPRRPYSTAGEWIFKRDTKFDDDEDGPLPVTPADRAEALRVAWRQHLRNSMIDMTPEERTALKQGIAADIHFMLEVFGRYRD